MSSFPPPQQDIDTMFDLVSSFVSASALVRWLLYLLAIWLVYRVRLAHALAAAIDQALRGEVSLLLGRARGRWAEWQGDFATAAELYENVSDYHRAIACHERASNFIRCAELCLELGASTHAAEWLEFAGEHRRAATLFLDEAKFDRAASAYLKGGAHLLAAASLVKGKRYLRAAELYREYGAFLSAGEAFERAGNYERAGECFERAAVEPATEGDAPGSSIRAADCFEKAGSLDRAARALARGQHYRLAALMLERLENFSEAGDLYERAGDNPSAARAFAAAKRFSCAARAALRAGAMVEAAGHLEESGNLRDAAVLLRKSGQEGKAALLFARSGAYFEAARSANAARDEKLMAECLSLVPPDDPDFDTARTILAQARAPRRDDLTPGHASG